MQPRRVTQRDVARVAGVTRPAVSLAFKYHPSIPKTTRDRIFQIAKDLGYVPDPVLSSLAAYRWPSSRKKRATVAVAMIDLWRKNETQLGAYMARLRQGITDRATELGFDISLLRLADYGGNLKQLLRVIRSRGITGLILLPSDGPVSLDPAVNWDGLSVVTATTSVIAPRFHQVVPNQLSTMSALIEKMELKGYRKIGAIFSDIFEHRTTHSYSMALAWFGHRDRILVLPEHLAAEDQDRQVHGWLRSSKPDLVFAPNNERVARLIRAKRSTLVITDLNQHIEQFSELVGESAVRLLSGMIYNNETGVPQHPQITAIDGSVREAGKVANGFGDTWKK